MSFGSALYRLLIGPLELMFEVIFAIADRLVGNHGIAIIFLSLAINFLVLPLYRRADALQREQRDKAARMQAGVAHIKKTFQGNERFMMLQTFYRQHDYKQTDVFKGSISLLLQVPFFTAAYRFLSGLQLQARRNLTDLFRKLTDIGVDPHADDDIVDLFHLRAHLCQDPAEFAASRDDIVGPFDPGREIVEGPDCLRSRHSHNQRHHGDPVR